MTLDINDEFYKRKPDKPEAIKPEEEVTATKGE